MRKPVRKTSLFKFMTVLKLEVWFSIVAALIVTGFMVWFLDKYSPYSARNNKKAYPYPCRCVTVIGIYELSHNELYTEQSGPDYQLGTLRTLDTLGTVRSFGKNYRVK